VRTSFTAACHALTPAALNLKTMVLFAKEKLIKAKVKVKLSLYKPK
jgi:hypothetical protein